MYCLASILLFIHKETPSYSWEYNYIIKPDQ